MLYFRFFLVFVILTTPLFNSQASDFRLKNLLTEYAQTPLGVDVVHPRFSWRMESDKPGFGQSAYQLMVFNEVGDEVWNSGQVPGSESLNIRYEGDSLKACTRYTWQLRVWDQNNQMCFAESWFETGLMDAGASAWDGAQWIGGGSDDLVLFSQYLPVFKINFIVQLDEASKSTRAGFVYGANDQRLMDRNKNIFELENPKDSSYIMVELDVSRVGKGSNGGALLNIYRVGYTHQDDGQTPIRSFEVPDRLINDENRYEPHRIFLSSDLGHTVLSVGGEGTGYEVGALGLNPYGNGGDYIAYPVVGEIGFFLAKGQKARFFNVEVRNLRAPSNLLFSGSFDQFEKEESFQGLYAIDPSRNAMPMLRSGFEVKPDIAKARLYVTSRGIYDVFINGKRVGEDYFNPGFTQYNKTLFYQTYDVTDYIQQGENAVGAILGEGWWSGGSTYMGQYWNYFGDRQSLLVKLVVTYSDGETDVIVSNPETWRYFNNGPILYSSLFQGEVYDARKECLIEGWATAVYDDSAWEQSVEVELCGTINRDEGMGNAPGVGDHSSLKILGQSGSPVREIKELQAVSVEEVRPGVFIYDMGQNLAGGPKIHLRNTFEGQQITLRFSEVKYPDLPAYEDNVGMVMLENIRAAMAQEIFIANGKEAVISPRFTFHGFRYIEVTGIASPLALSDVKAKVLSSVHELASKYETSNQLVNKLWENITWSTYSNFVSVPIDCPQRNERLGWSGDISVFSRTASYLATMPQFLRRHLLAMRDVQREDGRFPDVAPLGVGFGETLWGSAGITVAWESYLQYGDSDLLDEHYAAMYDYLVYLLRDISPDTGIFKEDERDVWGSLGDWLSLEDRNNEKLLFWEAYLIYNLELMSKMALVLNKPEEADWFSRLYSERKAFFNATYLDDLSGKTVFGEKVVDTQASYALPLAFNIVSEEHVEKVVDNFVHTITRSGKTDQNIETPPYSLMTGFIGTAWISKALSDCGRTDLAYRLLQQTEYPSWLYPVKQGATTIWERLNSYTHTDGFGGNNNMNSFNHYAFGAVGAWMYGYSLGIRRDEDAPGFKHFILQPEPDPTGSMTFARGHYESMYGRIESAWESLDSAVVYKFKVPSNTKATLILKAHSLEDIVIHSPHLHRDELLRFVEQEGGRCVFEVLPGTYEIEVKK